MFNFEKLNNVAFDVDTKGMGYTTLKDLFEVNDAKIRYNVLAIYINRKSEFAEEMPLVVIDDEGVEIPYDADKYDRGGYVNLPQHQLYQIKEILDTPEAVEAVKKGRLGFTIEPYYSQKKNETCYSAKFCNFIPGENSTEE